MAKDPHILHEWPGTSQRTIFLELVARALTFRGDFVVFPWAFRGSESLRSKHLLTLGWFLWSFVGINGRTINEIRGIIGGFFVAFSWTVGALPAIENMHKPIWFPTRLQCKRTMSSRRRRQVVVVVVVRSSWSGRRRRWVVVVIVVVGSSSSSSLGRRCFTFSVSVIVVKS